MIWVVAGTREARRCIDALLAAGYGVVATTATGFGRGLIEPHPRLVSIAQTMDAPTMEEFIAARNVRLVVDASHPYSVEVSNNAMAAAAAAAVPYVRYERASTPVTGALTFPAFQDAARFLEDKEGNVLLAIGSRNLGCFKEGPKRTVYARILPLAESLAACEKAGIGADRIIAMRFSFSVKLHCALFEDLRIRYLVTKESGDEGGMPQKMEAARSCGVDVLVVGRPRLSYPAAVRTEAELISFAGASYHG